jgi:integrase
MKTLEVLERILKGKRLARNSQKNYGYALKSLNDYTEEWPDNAAVINEWITQIPKTYSDETVKLYFRVCKAAGNYMQRTMGRDKEGRFKFFNAFDDAEIPQVSKKKRRYFSVNELVEIMKACRGEQEYALISTFVDSMCRVGDIGYDPFEPERHPGLLGRNVGDDCLNLKGKTGEYTYRLDYRICKELKKLAGGDDQPVFRGSDGGIATVSELEHTARKIIKRAGITGKKVGPHTLRHSGASLVAKKTQSALIVKALLNQEKIDTAMIYIHDSEASVSKEVSPMALMKVKPVEQLGLVEDTIESNIIDSVDLTEEMFDAIPNNIGIRPLLKSEDLSLLRTIMVEYCRTHKGDSKVYKSQELLKRILRKVK